MNRRLFFTAIIGALFGGMYRRWQRRRLTRGERVQCSTSNGIPYTLIAGSYAQAALTIADDVQSGRLSWTAGRRSLITSCGLHPQAADRMLAGR